MSKFEVGDRVAVYYAAERITGVITSIQATECSISIQDDKDTEGQYVFRAHPKQCRKLKPKKQREWDIAIPAGKTTYRPIIGEVGTFRVGSGVSSGGPEWTIGEIVRVREVRK